MDLKHFLIIFFNYYEILKQFFCIFFPFFCYLTMTCMHVELEMVTETEIQYNRQNIRLNMKDFIYIL